MATLSDSIQLIDFNMQEAFYSTIDTYGKIQEATVRNLNVKVFELTRNQIKGMGEDIGEAEKKQNSFNDKVKSLANVFKKVGDGAKVFISAADSYANTQARLNVINDGLQTTDELNNKIFASAGRSRVSYAKLSDDIIKMGMNAGDAFGSNDEMIYFTELLTKSFKISGTSAQDQSDIMDKLTQAMASGSLQGDGLNAVLTKSPKLAESIAAGLGVSVDVLKDMGSEGLITSDVLKSGLFNSADEINSEFNKMPITFSENVTAIKNSLLKSLQPAFQSFSDFINSESGQEFFVLLGNGLSKLVNAILWISNIITQYWPTFVSALLFIIELMTALWVQTKLAAFWEGMLGIKTEATTGALFASEAATSGLNNAWKSLNNTQKANVILFIISLLIALGLWLYNTWQKSDAFAAGVLRGWNLILNFFDKIPIFLAKLSLAFVTKMLNLRIQVLQIAEDLVNGIINRINGLIEIFNTITGLEIQTIANVDFTTNAENEKDAFIKAAEDEIALMEENALIKAAEREQGVLDYLDKREAERKEKEKDNFSLDNWENDSTLDSVGLVEEVGSINDTVDISSEDLAMMRELAEMQSIQNFVTLTPTVQMTTGDVHNEADINTIVQNIERKLEEEFVASAEGVYK